MKKHFKKTTRLYFQEEIRGINPISETDAAIFSEIIDAVRKIGRTDLHTILTQYKQSSDTDVLDSLIDWHKNNNTVDEVDEEGNKKKKIPWIVIGDHTLLTKHFRSIEKYEYTQQGRRIYALWINKSEGVIKNAYSNLIIAFESQLERQGALEKIYTHLEAFDSALIIK